MRWAIELRIFGAKKTKSFYLCRNESHAHGLIYIPSVDFLYLSKSSTTLFGVLSSKRWQKLARRQRLDKGFAYRNILL